MVLETVDWLEEKCANTVKDIYLTLHWCNRLNADIMTSIKLQQFMTNLQQSMKSWRALVGLVVVMTEEKSFCFNVKISM